MDAAGGGVPGTANRLGPGYAAADLADLRILHKADLQALLEDAAEKGGKRALAAIGLHDEDAAKDVRDLRDWLKAWRIAKSTAISTTVAWTVRGLLLAVVIGIVASIWGVKLPPIGK